MTMIGVLVVQAALLNRLGIDEKALLDRGQHQ